MRATVQLMNIFRASVNSIKGWDTFRSKQTVPVFPVDKCSIWKSASGFAVDRNEKERELIRAVYVRVH